MTRLSVNVNKLATLRNARGKNLPNLLQATLDIIAYGAEGITVHPRPDGRHIRPADVYAIASHINVDFNIEGYPDQQFLALVKQVGPTQCTLVPDPPHVLTSNAGWQLAKNRAFLQDVIAELQQSNIRTSLFVDPYQLNQEELAALLQIKSDGIELYTEAYADAFGTPKGAEVLAVYAQAAHDIHALGMAVHAGHDLNLDNLAPFIAAIPIIQEVSIGHALICDALYFGLPATIQKYLQCLGKIDR